MARKSGSLRSILEFSQFLEGVSANVHGVLDEAKLYRIVKKEFSKSNKYSATIFRVTDDPSKLKVAQTSLSPTRRSKGGETTRVRLKGRPVDLSRSKALTKVVKKGRTIQTGLDELVAEVIPGVSFHGFPRGRHTVLTPLKRQRRTIGVLAVSVPSMSTELVSSVRTFSRHISAALELSDQYADRKRVEDELRSSREQLRSLSSYLQSVREEERSHVAREIHDELGQTITALKLDLLGLKDELSRKQKRLAKKAGSMVGLTDRSLQAVHKICGELRPKFLDDLGLAAALEWQAEEFQKRTGTDCAMEVGPQDLSVDSDLSIALFRVFQEALTNVARHADATKVEASLRRINGKVVLEVKDNGRGITKGQAAHPRSFGLVGMRERIRPYGGELKIRGRRGKGTDLTVVVPLEEAPLRPIVTPRMVGRDKERRRLRSLYRKAEKKDSKLILVHGEAGIGKTRLVTEFAQDLETRGATVLTGACREDTRAIPYYPFREALNRFLDTRMQEGTKVFSDLPDYAKWELSRLLPDLKTPGLAEFEPATDHFRLFESFRLFIQGLADQSNRPLFFAVEDLHVSDDASLDLLHYLARNLSKSGVQLCVTYRTEEAHEDVHKLTASLQKERLSANVALSPLSSDDVSEMVDLLRPGSGVPRKLSELLYKRSEGNPFFVQEMTKLLTTEDIRQSLSKKKTIPKAIKSVLQRRIDTLGPGPREILSCGALVGEEFEFEVLQTALGRAPMEVMEAVEAGTRAYIVRESPSGKEERYRFTHSLMADVLYSGIGKVRRKLWHSKVGDALEQHYADRLEVLNGRLTHHFELAENWEKAFTYALASAKQAKETYANEEALLDYRKALSVLHRMSSRELAQLGAEVLALHEGLADVLFAVGRGKEAFSHYNRMRELAKKEGKRVEEARALRKLSTALQGDYAEAREILTASLEISRDADDREGSAESLLLIGDTAAKQGMLDDALRHFERSLALARSLGNRDLIARCFAGRAEMYATRGSYDEALVAGEKCLEALRQTRDRHLLSGSLRTIARAHIFRRSYREAERCVLRSLSIARDIGHMRAVATALSTLGDVQQRLGSLDEAVNSVSKALAISRATGDPELIAANLHNLGVVHLFSSKHEEALRYLKEALEMQRGIGNKLHMAHHLLHIGVCFDFLYRPWQALKYFGEAVAIYTELGSRACLLSAHFYEAQSKIRVGMPEVALSLFEHCLTLAKELGDRDMEGRTSSQLGSCLLTLGRLDEALSRMELACTLATNEDAKARALGGLASVYHDMGDREKVNQMMDRMTKIAKTLQVNSPTMGQVLFTRASLAAPDKSLEYAMELLEHANRYASPGHIMIAEKLVGRALGGRGDWAAAREHYRRAKDIAQDLARQIRSKTIRKSFLNKRDIRELFAELEELERRKPRKAKS